MGTLSHLAATSFGQRLRRTRIPACRPGRANARVDIQYENHII